MAALQSRLSGRIAYRAAAGHETGWETFDLLAGTGGRLLRALCVMDDIGLVRDVSLGMGHDWRPTDGQCRIWHGPSARLMRFAIEPGGVREGDSFVPIAAPLPYLGLHPLSGDALIVHQRGTDSPGAYHAIDAVTYSVTPNGDADLGLQAIRIAVAFLGAEPCTVAAGAFGAWHYRLRWREDWPAADLWVRQGDGMFLALRWAMIPAWFELTDWSAA